VYYIIYIVSCNKELQRCRKEECQHQVGFMNPVYINEHTLNTKYQETCQNMYKALTAQYYKPYILLPYNFK
jgi:hypothetical protein